MSDLTEKIRLSLDEDRMLVLVVQVLIGFQFRGVFEPGFEKLSPAAQYFKLAAFGLLLLTLALLLTVPSYHRIVEKGNSTPRFAAFVTNLMSVALLPFAVALGCDLGIVGGKLFGVAGGWIVGLAAGGVALFFWYGIGLIARTRGMGRSKMKDDDGGKTPLADKIKQILTEGRIILPGAQALLGFQLSGFFTDAFEKLEPSSQLFHFAALAFVALAAILLMTPPAYHRIVEKGEETERFHRVANRFIIVALIPLALGITTDFYVVLNKVSHNAALSSLIAAVVLALFYGLWFLYPWLRARADAVRT